MKKRKSLLLALVLALVFAVSFALVACPRGNDDDDKVTTEGPETGNYYSDDRAEESLFSMNSGDRFTLSVGQTLKSGTYKLDGQTLALTYNIKEEGETAETASAEYRDNKVYLRYDNVDMVFLRIEYFDVVFDSQGGSDVATESVRNGRTATEPVKPTKADSVFRNWYVGSNSSEEFNFTSAITAKTTLKANWTTVRVSETEFTISFDLNLPNGVSSTQNKPANIQTVGGLVFDTTPLSAITGYTFGGWWISQYNESDKLTRKVSTDVVFEENTTLFAMWISTASSNKLAVPAVEIQGNKAAWDFTADRFGYRIEKADGTLVKEGTTTDRGLDLSELGIGEYVLMVRSDSTNASQISDYAVRYFKVNTLARVSLFEVFDGILVFASVEHAEKYSILVDCGNSEHNHTDYIDLNGLFYYDFNTKGCEMQPGGIKFTVKAEAAGWLTSFGEYVFERNLEKVTGHAWDSNTNTLSWKYVARALSYEVKIMKGETVAHSVTTSNLSINLAHLEKDAYTAIITPKTKGFNSPTDNTAYSFTKLQLTAPKNIIITDDENMVISWDGVHNAKGYVVTIVDNGTYKQTYAVSTPSCTITDLTWIEANAVYTVTVIATADTDADKSPASVATEISRGLPATISYSENTISWAFVMGAKTVKYTISGGNPVQTVETTVATGATTANVEKLLVKGTNKISVAWFDAADDEIGSREINVTAYAVTFVDVHPITNAESPTTVYLAKGDSIAFPTAATVEGYDLAGWYKEKAYTNKIDGTSFKLEVESDISIYSKLSAKAVTLTFNYDSQENYFNATGEETSKTIYYNSSYKLPVPSAVYKDEDTSSITNVRTATVMTFTGWYSLANGPATRYTNELGESIDNWTSVTGVTMYARWVESLIVTEMLNARNEWVVSVSPNYASTASDVKNLVIPETIRDMSKTSAGTAYPVVEISAGAFSRVTTIVSAYIPKTVRSIYGDAFSGAVALEKIVVDGNNEYYSSSTSSDTVIGGVLYNKLGTELLYFPVSAKDNNGNLVSAYTIPANITAIGDYAFYSHALAADDNRTTINEREESRKYFRENRLTNITFANNSKVATIGAYAFYGNKNLLEIDVPASVKTISKYAFVNTGLTTVTLREGLEKIDDGAFIELMGLVTINLPNTLTYIGSSAFEYCRKLQGDDSKTITIPRSVTFVGANAFSDCYGFEKIIFDGSYGENDNTLFSDTAEQPLNVPAHMFGTYLPTDKTMSDNASDWVTYSKALKSIEFNRVISSIGIGAFKNAALLTSIEIGTLTEAEKATAPTFPDGLTLIADEAFYGCGLTKIKFPNSLEKIGASAFRENSISHYTNGELVIPNNVTEIGSSAFSTNSYTYRAEGASSDTTSRINVVRFGDSLKNYKGNWFAGAALTTVYIGKSMTNIADLFSSYYTFFSEYDENSTTGMILHEESPLSITEVAGSRVLWANKGTSKESVVFLKPATAVALGTMSKITAVMAQNTDFRVDGNDVDIVFSAELEEITANAFEGATGIRNIIFQNNPVIGEGAFKGTDIKGVYFGGLTTLGSYMFADCTELLGNLRKETNGSYTQTGILTIPSTIAVISAGAFQNCTSLTKVVIEEKVTRIGGSAFAGTTNLTGTSTITANASIDGQAHSNVLVLPSTLVDVGTTYATGANAFDGSGISGVVFTSSTLATLNTSLFANTTNLEYLDLGNNAFLRGNTLLQGSALNYLKLNNLSVQVGPSTVTTATTTVRTETITTTITTFTSVTTIKRIIKTTIATGVITNDDTTTTAVLNPNFESLLNTSSLTIDAPNHASHAYFNETYFVYDGIMFKYGEGDNVSIYKYSSGRDSENGAIVTGGTTKPNSFKIPNGLTANASGDITGFWYNGDAATKRYTVTHMETSAFAGATELYYVDLNGFAVPNSAFRGSSLREIPAYTSTISMGTYAFADLTYTGTLHINAGNFNGANAFSEGKFTHVTTAETGVVFGGEKTFANCTALITATLNVPSLPNYAVGGTTSLTTLNLPKLQKFGNNVFRSGATAPIYTSSLTSLELPHTLDPLEAFTNLTFNGTNITLTAAAKGALTTYIEFRGSALYHVNGTNSEETLMRYDNSNTTATLEIGAAVTGIASNVFTGNTSLTTVKILGPVNRMGTHIFSGCTNLATVELNAAITKISASMFENCSSLTTLKTIGQTDNTLIGITEIGAAAFNRCVALASLAFDSTSAITSIGSTAFRDMSALTTLTFAGTVGTIGTAAFQSSHVTNFPSRLTSLTFSGTSEVANNAFYNCAQLTSITFAGATDIALTGATIFRGCTLLANITFEGRVTHVAENAFNYHRPTAGAAATVTFAANTAPTGLSASTPWHSAWQGNGANISNATFNFTSA